MSWSSELRFLLRGVRLPLRILGFRERPGKIAGKCVLLGKVSSGFEDWARFGRLGFLDCSHPGHRVAVPCNLQEPALLSRQLPCSALLQHVSHCASTQLRTTKAVTAYQAVNDRQWRIPFCICQFLTTAVASRQQLWWLPI